MDATWKTFRQVRLGCLMQRLVQRIEENEHTKNKINKTLRITVNYLIKSNSGKPKTQLKTANSARTNQRQFA